MNFNSTIRLLVDEIQTGALDCGTMDVKEIENAISRLPPSEIAELAKWFEEFHARLWDDQIERDLKVGRLDSLLTEAEQSLESGGCEKL